MNHLSFSRFYFKGSVLTLILFVCIIPLNAQKQSLVFEKASVVSAHPDASRIGLEILQKGGNAYDAAIATEFALAVCFPVAGNLGGGGFWVYRKNTGETGALDYREKAPALAYRDMYLDDKGNPIELLSKEGHLAAGVPGTVAGLFEAHQRLGSLPWKDLVQPAIDLARNGVVLTEKEAKRFNNLKSEILKYNTHRPYFIKDTDWLAGEKMQHTDLANTLERIRDNGRDGFYTGITADLIVKEMSTAKGIISLTDLKNYNASWRTPLIGKYKEYKIIAMPPPSSGGLLLLQMFGMLENFEIAPFGFQSSKSVQLMTEIEKRAFADRATYMGDADFYPVPVNNLIDKNYLKNRIKNFSFDKIISSQEIKSGTFSAKDTEETTHYCVVDEKGNAVSVTTTLNGTYGSKVIVKDAGFFLNNEMDDFSVKPNFPNMFGLVGGEANAIKAFKKPLSSMTPTILEKDGKLFIVVGTPGGSTIPTSVFQSILNVIEFRMPAQEAVSAPRFHHQWLPDQIFVEPETFDANLRALLAKSGYTVFQREQYGRVEMILCMPDGKLQTGADSRGDDKAAGY